MLSPAPSLTEPLEGAFFSVRFLPSDGDLISDELQTVGPAAYGF
jgi:hypothetical protein